MAAQPDALGLYMAKGARVTLRSVHGTQAVRLGADCMPEGQAWQLPSPGRALKVLGAHWMQRLDMSMKPAPRTHYYGQA